MMEHAPGPWTVEEGYYVVDVDGFEIADTRNCGVDGDIQAIAHLIAAAPELLEACKLAEDNSLDLPKFVRDTLEAAIAKAEGK